MNALQQAVPQQQAGLVVVQLGELVTTTVSVAAGTANSHEAVIKLVRTHLADFEEFGGVRFEIEPFATAGGQQKREIAFLNEDQATLLITYMRNNVIVRRFKIALVREFGDMRRRLAAPAIPNFEDPIAAGEAWIAAKKEARDHAARANLEATQRQQLEHQVHELAPAAAGFERIAGTGGTLCITDAAKDLQTGRNKLIDLLLRSKWMYIRPGKRGYLAYQKTIEAGYLTHKQSEYEDPRSGEQKTADQVRITKRGLAKLALLLGAETGPPGLRTSLTT